MKFRNLLLNLAVGLSALLFGLAWVGIYQLFVGNTNIATISCGSPQENVKVVELEDSAFDINDPESVLPIDFEEDKLSDPKEDENNPEYFDPEGTYFILENTHKDFQDFSYFTIKNKNFDVDAKDTRFGEYTTPKGSITLNENNQIEIESLSLSREPLQFESKTSNGIKYEFDGKFVVNGNFYTLDENAEVLKGTLTKKKDGKIIAIANVTFGWTLE